MLLLSYKKRKLKQGETPQLVFEKLKTSYSFLLQSGGGERCSFIGYQPAVLLEKNGKKLVKRKFTYGDGKVTSQKFFLSGDVLKEVASLNKKYLLKNLTNVKDLPPFVGGACGFFSYDFGVEMAGLKVKTKALVKCPDLCLMWVKKLIAFDHKKNELWFLALGKDENEGRRILQEMEKDYVPGLVNQNVSVKSCQPLVERARVVANFSFPDYKNKIQQIKKFLFDGDTYQVNFAQQFKLKTELDPWLVYKKLFEINPSQQACFFNHPDFCVVSASPERLVSVKNGLVQTCPIKGTVKRGKNSAEDKKQIKDLLASVKDKAELAMIVDLSRNDLGRVCEPGTIKVTQHRAIMKLSHVIHTYSVVEGLLAKGKNLLDVFKALFPGGSITGCPKKRTMEIIAKLEQTKRGAYCGSAGYFSASGNMDLNIMIRTLFYQNGQYTFGAGGGIVIDSDAGCEYQESLDKAEALKRSLLR